MGVIDRLPLFCPQCGASVEIQLRMDAWKTADGHFVTAMLTGVYGIACPKVEKTGTIVCFESKEIHHDIRVRFG